MKKNIGKKDRILRFVLGVILLVLILFFNNIFIRIGLGLLGLFCIYEAVVGWCALNAILGKNTCPIN